MNQFKKQKPYGECKPKTVRQHILKKAKSLSRYLLAFCALSHSRLFRGIKFYSFNRWMFNLSLRGIGVLNHEDDIVSGEVYIAKKIRDFMRSKKPEEAIVVFDIGANVGDWTIMAANIFERATIYSFEPIPSTFSILSKNVIDYGLVVPSNIALGSRRCCLEMYDYSNNSASQRASIYQEALTMRASGVGSVKLQVQATTVDLFTLEHRVDHISFMKIDVEGHEFEVLRGASDLIKNGRVDFIQFEFNEMNVLSRVFMQDMIKILNGYKLYRIFQDGLLPIGNLSVIEMELFAFQNIFAARNDIADEFE